METYNFARWQDGRMAGQDGPSNVQERDCNTDCRVATAYVYEHAYAYAYACAYAVKVATEKLKSATEKLWKNITSQDGRMAG